MGSNDSHHEILQAIDAWHAAGKRCAVATVIRTWGSSPRPAGSQLAVDQDGAFVGSVSGGCIEAAVVKEALEVMASQTPRSLEFGIADRTAWEVGLACGGKVALFVEPHAPDDPALGALRQAVADKRAAVLATRLADGAHQLILAHDAEPDADHAGQASEATDQASAALRAAARSAMASDRSTCWPIDARQDVPEPGYFLHVFNPRLRMIVVGAVHIAQSLVPMAQLAGFDVVVVDPRQAFATAERFPGVTISHEWPDEALGSLGLDARSAVVTLTHDPKLDDPALMAALQTPAFYVGALGSTRTQAARALRLAKRGVSDNAMARIHGPVGLDIGARAAPEIAVSIMAQVIARLRLGQPADRARGGT